MIAERIPRELTVEQAMRFLVTKGVALAVSSEMIHSADGKKVTPKPKIVQITKESEIRPELILKGPVQRGEVNVYVLVNAHKAYFNAKTGEALGCDLAAPEVRTGKIIKLQPPTGQDAKFSGTDRRYIR